MPLKTYAKAYRELTTRKNLKGKDALEAVRQNGDALRYVSEDMFGEEVSKEITTESLVLPEGHVWLCEKCGISCCERLRENCTHSCGFSHEQKIEKLDIVLGHDQTALTEQRGFVQMLSAFGQQKVIDKLNEIIERLNSTNL